MSSTSRIHRLLRLITTLQGGRTRTVAELAEELEVSRRTVFRDLNMLELAGVPYFFDPEAGGYRIREQFFLPPVNLTLEEALAILALANGPGRAVPLLEPGRAAATKLESALPQVIRDQIGGVIGRMDVSLGPVSGHDGLHGMFHQLAGAIVARRICQIVYISFSDRKQLPLAVRPLRMMFVNRAWYLIAYAASFRAIRTFKLGRIRKLTVTAATFTQPRGVDVDKYFGNAWSMIPEGKLYDVRLHFGSQVAGNVAEVRWHKSQRVKWNEDGSIDLQVRVDGLREITWWILGYGDQVEVIAPQALRKKVAGIAAAMASRYSGKGH